MNDHCFNKACKIYVRFESTNFEEIISELIKFQYIYNALNRYYKL